jgi:hypothetical protein
MTTKYKGFKAEENLIELIEKMQDKEHLNFSPLIKRIVWDYAERYHPDEAAEAKKKSGSSS